MTGYVWTVSGGGTVTSGGTGSSNTVTVTWNTAGAQSVSVNYTNGFSCTAVNPTVYNVTVNPNATITLTSGAGTNIQSLCVNNAITNITYSISGGGTGAGVTGLPTGVTGSYNAGVFTISGTPSVTGTFNYTVTTTGTCTQATATGTITVNPNATITLTSSPSTANQSLCINNTIANITYSIGGGGTGAGVTGLPTGVNGVYATGIFTISGTPSVTGTFNYTVTTTGTCVQNTATGTITVNPDATITLTSGAGTNSQSLCVNNPITNITYSIGGGGAGAGITGLPAGVTGSYTSGVFTISGSPSVTGTYNYTVTTTGTCSQATATGTITVNPKPVPTITGAGSICGIPSAGNVYYTETGMSAYSWNITGGTITAGTGTNSITVTWTSVGAQTLSVTYTNTVGCNPVTPTLKTVNVFALPVPVITGPTPVCSSPAVYNYYYVQPGMTNYQWTHSAGAVVIFGGGTGDDYITLILNVPGAQWVAVNYTDANGCTALAPTVYNITVNPTPVPTLSGPSSVCVNSTGNVYTTETSMSNYVWNISAGGNITAGGGTGDNTVTITWTGTGAQTVKVKYTNGSCTSGFTTYNVTVNPLPTPTLSGPAPVCVGSTGNVYTTQGGMTGYIWNVSSGGTVTAGGTGTSNTVTVTWNNVGAQSVSVNYTTVAGCQGASPAVYPVTVNALPVPTITGPTPVCVNSTGNVYSTETGMTNYLWNVTGGAITAGGGTGNNTVTVTWTGAGVKSVSVNYTNGNGCTASTPTVYNVIVNTAPVPTISGPADICGTPSTGNIYTTETGMTGYTWSVSGGGTITGGSGSNSITVTWTIPGSQSVSVNYNNANGCTAASATVYPVVVHQTFVVGSISADQTINTGTAPAMLIGVAPTGGITPYTYQWQSSTDNINFTDITVGGTSLNYQPPALSQITWYRLKQTSSGPCVATLITNKVKITLGFKVSGYLTYDNQATNNFILSGVTVYIKDGPEPVPPAVTPLPNILATTTTDANGYYEFYIVNGNYYLYASSTAPWAGVSADNSLSSDLTQLKRYIGTVQPNTVNDAIRVKASDINQDGNVNNLDVTPLQRRVAGQLPNPNYKAPDWFFENPNIYVNNANVLQNFLGICSGEVNGTYPIY